MCEKLVVKIQFTRLNPGYSARVWRPEEQGLERYANCWGASTARGMAAYYLWRSLMSAGLRPTKLTPVEPDEIAPSAADDSPPASRKELLHQFAEQAVRDLKASPSTKKRARRRTPD